MKPTNKLYIYPSYLIPTLLTVLGFLCFSSCKVYQENVLFKTENDYQAEVFQAEVQLAEKNYSIKPYDIIQLEVFTNKGEIIIDPNMEIMRESGGGGAGMARNLFTKEFRIDSEGLAYLPMIGATDLTNKTLYQADSFLIKQYSEYYKDAFVRTSLVNKRVVVLGAMGGHVVPLTNDGINLIEVLAMTGGLENNARGSNIRLIRGDLKNPAIQVIDLTTIDGLRKASLDVQDGDIIYIEPLRRVVIEGLRDVTPVIGMVSNVITLFVVIQTLRNSQSDNTP